MEMLVSLLLGGIVVTAVWQLADTLQAQRQSTRERAAAIGSGLHVRSALNASLADVGTGMVSAPNWSAIQVRTADTPDGAQDTLLIFKAAGAQVRASASACPSGATPCVLLVGDHSDAFFEGDIVAVGSSQTGVRLWQVSQVGPVVTQSCGADCEGEILQCTVAATGTVYAPVVVSSTRITQGVPTPLDGPCSQSFWADGTQCVETVETQAVGQAAAGTCIASGGQTQIYTEIRGVDRTAVPFGYPDLSTFTPLSGGAATPRVTVQRLRFVRYLLHTGSGSSALVKQVNLTPGGMFGPSLPVAADILSFRVESLHAGESDWTRGVGVADADLALGAGNPNYTWASAPGGSGAQPARRFQRSYRTIGAVRVLFTLQTPEPIAPNGLERETTLHRTVVATPGILEQAHPLTD